MVDRPLVLRIRDAIERPLSLGAMALLAVLVALNPYLEFVGQPGPAWGVLVVGAPVTVTLVSYRFDSRIDDLFERRAIAEERALRSVLLGLLGSHLAFTLWTWSPTHSRGRVGTFSVAIAAMGVLSVLGATLVYRLEPRRRLLAVLSGR